MSLFNYIKENMTHNRRNNFNHHKLVEPKEESLTGHD